MKIHSNLKKNAYKVYFFFYRYIIALFGFVRLQSKLWEHTVLITL